ncbi:MAG: hypothetical protein Q9216_002959 [Gyalolechia sp. 2 TL-2023]
MASSSSSFSSSSPPTPVRLIIRFALPVPDLPLTVPCPKATTPLHLLHQHIRPHLPEPYRSCPVRLIASGAILPPSTTLSACLRLPHKPPPPPPSIKGKGPESSAIYIHCSVSTNQTLSPSVLAAEASASISPPSAPADPPPVSSHQDDEEEEEGEGEEEPQQQQGFDRLLSAGLHPTEIASLRSQFLAITAHSHTPDTMPSPTAMRRLEERWLDSSSSPPSNSNGSNVNGPGGMEIDDNDDDGRGALEDMLWGNLMGFFWPVGAAVWLMREEGVWSKRRQVAVVTGVLVNLAFGVMRVGGA